VHIKVYLRVEKIQVVLTQVWCDHCGIRGSIAHLYTASRGGKRKKVKPSMAEESKPIDWTWTAN